MSDTVIQPRPLGHALAGERMSGARMIMQVLADEGVTAIFGYSGGAILPTYDAVFLYNQQCARLGEPQIPLIVPANEQGAGFMAAGYARASGRVGVCLVTSGPGATNTVTPVRDCMADSIPIVVICGQVATPSIGTDAFQEAPVPSMMGSVAKHIFLVTDSAKLEATVRTAFEIARTGRPGPVVVDIAKAVGNWEGVFLEEGLLPILGYRRRMRELAEASLDAAAAERFFAMLGESRRPLIYAGGGVINGNAAGALAEFTTAFNVPVVTTLMGIGALDTTHPLAMRMLGMHGAAFANYAVDDCDFLIAVGSRFDDRVAGVPAKFARNARRIAHLDVDRAEVNKVKRVHWSHVGLVGEALRSLTAYGLKTQVRRDFSPWLAELAELETATTYDLPVKVVVLNNFGDGMVKQWQKLFFKGRLSASDRSLHKKDFVKAAQADGFRYAARLERKEDVPRVIGEFLAFAGPAFLEVMIDPDAGVYPMVGPGQTYEDMITGDFIRSRHKVDIKTPGPSEMF